MGNDQLLLCWQQGLMDPHIIQIGIHKNNRNMLGFGWSDNGPIDHYTHWKIVVEPSFDHTHVRHLVILLVLSLTTLVELAGIQIG